MNIATLAALVVLTLVLSSCGDDTQAGRESPVPETDPVVPAEQPHEKPASEGNAAYIARLQHALEQELFAHETYRAAASTFPRVRRFQNIASAESRHADMVEGLIRALGGAPTRRQPKTVVPPATVQAANAEGRAIELAVIALYKDLIKDCPDASITPTLERIQSSNRRHLNAFGG